MGFFYFNHYKYFLMKKLLLLCLSVCVFHTYAQEYPRKEINIRNFIQDIVGNPDGGEIGRAHV